MPFRTTGGPPRAHVRRRASAVTVLVCAALAPWPAVAAQVRAPRPSQAATTALDTITPARILGRLQEEAAAASPALAAGRANVEAARARARAAGLAPPMAISAGVSEAPNANLDQGNLRLEVGRDLFTGHRLRAERAVAEADVRAAEASLAAGERRVRAAVLRETIRAAGARLVAVRLAAEDALLAGGEDGVRARFAVGEARYVDVLRLRTERLRVQSARAEALADARAALATLGGLVGTAPASRAPSVPPNVVPPATPLAVPLAAPQTTVLAAALDTLAVAGLAEAWRAVLPADAATDSLIDAVTAAAADVQLATAAVARAEAERSLAAAGRRAQVEAFAGVQRIGQANNGPTLGPSLGVTVSLPFTAARANRLGAAASDRTVAAAETARAAAVMAARARVQAAAERYVAARERLTVFDAALLRGARDERESALAAYRTGGLTLLELVDFERALARAEIDRVRALVDAADAWADLVGGGDAEDEPTHSTTAPERR